MYDDNVIVCGIEHRGKIGFFDFRDNKIIRNYNNADTINVYGNNPIRSIAKFDDNLVSSYRYSKYVYMWI